MGEGVYKITDEFERELARYTGAPFAVAVDNCSNALFLALWYHIRSRPWPEDGPMGTRTPSPHVSSWRRDFPEITIPSRTYPSVPCAIIQSGGKVMFRPVDGTTLKGPYQLEPTPVWDSALRFSAGMYLPGTFICLSFTGPYKHLKLGKGGAILTDNPEANAWFRRARFSGRRERSYHNDDFDMLGWNYYMMPEIAARGLLLMTQFYEQDGTPKQNADLELPYPDLSKFPVYTRWRQS